MSRNTYIIDGNSLLFRSFYSMFRPDQPVLANHDGVPTNALYGYRNMMKKIKSSLKEGDKMIVCFDTGRKSFRTEKLASYKMNRKPAPNELKIQMPLARTLLDAMGIFHCEKEGFEGDDLAGSLTQVALREGDEVTLFTSDKDFLQLLQDGVKVEFLRKGLSEVQIFTKENIHDILGYKADQVIDFKGLYGDPSDNIPGVRGVGEKTAIKLLDSYPHLEEIFQGLEGNKTKTAQNILAQKDQALFCREIATIKRDVPVDEFYREGDYREQDDKALLEFYKEYDLSKFEKELEKEMAKKQEGVNESYSLFAEPAAEKETGNDGKYPPYKAYKELSSFGELPSASSVIVLNSNPNFHKGEVEGFFLSDGKETGFLSLEKAKKDPAFLEFLVSEKEKESFNLKGLIVALDKCSMPALKGCTFDLELAAYLLDNDTGYGKREILSFLGIDASALSDRDLEAYVCFLLPLVKEDVLNRLKEKEMSSLYSELEMPLTEVLAKMEIEGFPLDVPTLNKIVDGYRAKLDFITSQIRECIHKDINLNSPRQVGELIYDDLKLKKKGKTNSTSIQVLNSLADKHPVIPMLIEYRKYQKLVSSYSEGLTDYVYADKKIHGIYNQALTSTGRLSMSEPNLQNISMRDEEGKEIRKAFFYPDYGYQFLSLDYSQVELRVLASVAGIPKLIEVFNSGADIHTATASFIFHVPQEEVTPLMRRKAKAVNFGIVYGISPWGLSEQIHVSPQEASDIISEFYSSYAGLKEYEQKTILFAHENGYVKTLLNRRRYLSGINSENKNLVAFSERAAVNATIQGTAADLIKVAMVKIQKMLEENYKTKMVLQIHDELIFKVPQDEVGIVDKPIKDIMEHALNLKCHLVAEGSYGKDWFECK